MIKKFEIGKWYKYTGEKQYGWSIRGYMDFVLDGVPRKCYDASNSYVAAIGEDWRLWNWGNLNDWYEVSIKDKLDKILND